MRNFITAVLSALASLVILAACHSQAQSPNDTLAQDSTPAVYVCGSGNATKYHASETCIANRCAGHIAKMPLAQAERYGYTPCSRCCRQHGSNSGNSPSCVIPDSVQIEMARTAKGAKEQLISHLAYTVSYNPAWLIPNWVAYDLTRHEVSGTLKRPSRTFQPDPDVKGLCATHYDYSNTGYDRGHMAPAADMKWSEQAMAESFYTSNICPQDHELNGIRWERIEDRMRALAKEGVVYICCGPIVADNHVTIGKNKVAVPESFFKVACMQRRGKWQAIGFILPNRNCPGSMFDYAMSVDEVELATGHDFFYSLPDEIQSAIESSWKMQDWQ